MSLNLGFGFGVNRGALGALPDFALEFNGTDEYLQIALPNNIASGTVNDWTSSGSIPAGWSTSGIGTITWDNTETGKTGTYCLKVEYLSSTTIIKIPGLTIGKKYKIKIRYKGVLAVRNGNTDTSINLGTTSEWNTKSFIKTAVGTEYWFNVSSGTAYIDSISIKEDQGFDLNKDQEQILHSRNALFNNAGTDWVAKDGSSNQQCALSTTDKSEGTGSLLITSTGAGDATDHHVLLPSANIESCIDGKKYTIQGEARLDASSLGYGSDLVAGWDFTSGWAAQNGASITDANTFDSGVTGGGIYKNFSLTTGKVYKIVITATITGAGSPELAIWNMTNATNKIGIVGTGAGTYSQTLYFTAANGNIHFRVGTATAVIDVTTFELYESTPITLTTQLGTKSVNSGALSIVAGTFTKFVLNFLATASEQNQDLKLYLSGAGSVYVDKLSLTQKYDRVIIKKFKANSVATSTLLTMDGVNYLGTRSTGKLRFNIGDDNNSSVAEDSQVSYSASEWTNVIFLSDSTDKMYVIKNGVLPAGLSITTLGKEVTRLRFRVGLNGAGLEGFAGQISHLQIIRFENISQSTFNSAITGLQYPTGGGAEEVLRLTFQSGVSITECLKDYSPKAHTVSGVNVDITNRKRVTA